jgi:penicillin-insensitive murein endopeptidase
MNLEMSVCPAKWSLFVIAVGLAVPRPSSAGPPAESASRASVSVGTAMGGFLEQGEVLPKKGLGFRIRKETLARKARFGTRELVALVEDAAHRVAKKKPGSAVVVGDLSAPRGGELERHASHRSGRDVDFLFYLTDMKGRPVVNSEFIPVDANGFSTEPPMAFKFDIPRNWALVEALLLSRRATVQWIFVADRLRDLLLAHAQEQGVSPKILEMARQVLRQPGPQTHVDHFHVRIYCSPDHKPRCVDTGPRWAWAR